MADVETKTEETTKRTVKDFAIAKRSRLVFFVLNLALVIPFLVQNYSHWGLGGAFAIMLLSFFFLVIKPYEATPAARDIPLQLFFNVCLYLVVSYQSIIDNFKIDNLGYIFENMEGECVVLLLAGLAASLFIPKAPHLVWLRYIGKTAIGASVIMQIWAGGSVFEPEFRGSGETMIAFYLLFAVIWFAFCVISCHIDSAAYKRNNWLSNFLLIILVLFCTTENALAQMFIPHAKVYLLSMPTAALAWWKVIMSAIVLVGCAIVAFDYLNDTMGADALVLCFVASSLVILRVLMANYFAFNWIVFAIFLVSCVRCLKNELRQKKTLRLPTLGYAAVQLVAILISIWLIKAGLWINLIVVATYTLIFYVTVGKGISEKHRLRHWLTILSAPSVYAVAYIWHMRYSLDAIILIALAYVILAGVMIILHWPHPDKLSVPRGYKVIVCTLLVLLCWIAMGRFGAKVDVEFDIVKNTATVEIDAKGKSNDIEFVEYQWSTITGETLEVATMNKEGSSIPILGEVLTITVTDSRGVVTTKTEWYPDWLLSK